MRFFLFTLACLCSLSATAQPLALLPWSNPSFESEAQPSATPRAWFNCGSTDYSPPDLQPLAMFGELPPAQHGDTYVGLVIRIDGSTESLGQRLPRPLQANQCYQWQGFLAHAETYLSADPRRLGRTYNNAAAARLRVWGGMNPCDRQELLGSTSPVQSLQWESHTLLLHPSQAWPHLVLEAYFPSDSLANGHLLLDHLAPLLPVDCSTRAPLVPLTDISVPDLNDGRKLPSSLGEWGAAFSFLDDQPRAVLFRTADGSIHYGNPELYQLAASASQLPARRLTLGIQAADRQQFARRVQALERCFRELGFADLRLRMIRLSEQETGRGWSFHAPDAPLWIR
ncbi:MAG: hypothetical protein KDC54_02150 [Lewinella sp.]|nr:hypothetical protein [Lewinella sp.]